MANNQTNEAVIVSRDGFLAVGLVWEGTYAEAGAGGIRTVHSELQNRLKEIPHVVNSESLLGLSYHATPDNSGFTHYAVVEVEKVGDLPPGMVSVSVPTLTYAKCEHRKGQNIQQSYNNIYDWIRSQGLEENNVDHLTHFEIYPMSQDPYGDDPEFTIMLPVLEK